MGWMLREGCEGVATMALHVDSSLGLLLPCHVIVRQPGAGTVVEAIDPQR